MSRVEAVKYIDMSGNQDYNANINGILGEEVGILGNVSILRKAAGLTQEQLAKRLGVSRTTVCMWEIRSETPPSKYLLALSEALGCSVEDLLKPA